LCYAEQVEKATKREVECVEFEFLVRSAPQRGRYKPIAAKAERREVFVEQWKKDMWKYSADFTNFCMREMESSILDDEEELDKWSQDGDKTIPFEMIPRFTRNCLQKYGSKTYECEYYKACKTNVNPLLMTDYFTQDIQDE
jgi:hypothetical protein